MSGSKGQFDDAGGSGAAGSSAGSKRKADADPSEGTGGEFDAALAAKWAEIPRLGHLVCAPHGPFIPCKRPISYEANEKVDEGDRFDSGMFMDRQVNARIDVGLMIALVDPNEGLPLPHKREWEDWDTEYLCIPPKDAQQTSAAVHKAVQAFLKDNPRRMIGIFCDDGVNLTGHAVVSFLCRARNMPLPDALASFAAARPPGIFHQPYLDELQASLGRSTNPPAAPAAPLWAPGLPLVPATGAFSMPAIKPQPQQQPPAKKQAIPELPKDDLPPGWSRHWSKSHNKEYFFNKATGQQSWEKPAAAAGGGGAGNAPPEGGGGAKMGARHVLIKHKGSRRPQSWKDESGKAIGARNLPDAIAKAESFRTEITGAKDPVAKFKEVAKRESDCSSAHREGDLGPFAKGAMQPAFEKAVAALQVGEISRPVETDSGVHLILRTL